MPDNNEFYKNLLDNLYDGVYFVDRERLITYWNHGAERITGYEATHVVGHHCSDNILSHVTAEGLQLCKSGCPLAACMKDGKIREAEVFLHHASGYRVPVQVRVSPIRDGKGEIIGGVETFSSGPTMNEVRQEIVDLRKKVHTDALTGLYNRVFIERCIQGIIGQEAEGPTGTGVLFIDIDHFKEVNDKFGHEIGDQILKMISRTMKAAVRITDLVGRWGGEEFVALVFDAADIEDVKTVAEKVRALVQFSRLDTEKGSISVTVSIGGTLLLPTDSVNSVIKRADEFMYGGKAGGRNQTKVG
jgi:diguanylate cyclase (GGDEF)-like protein/PAS domain S-box-containing protein